MTKLKLYAAYFVAFIVFTFSIFFYGKQKGREDAKQKVSKKVIKAKEIDSLAFNDLVSILSERIHK